MCLAMASGVGAVLVAQEADTLLRGSAPALWWIRVQAWGGLSADDVLLRASLSAKWTNQVG
jgi:hypothetical protein